MGGEDDTRMCGRCGEEITGRALKAKESLFHEEKCFKCITCNIDLRDISVYEKEGKLYCDKDYKANFVPKCAKCSEYITENCVRAMDKTWHSFHFTCAKCSKPFSADVGYHEHNGFPYCEPCYTETALPRCKACDKSITDKALKAMGHQWHVKCFVCKDCKTTFEGQKSFYSIDDMPVCGPCAGIGDPE